MDEYHVVIPTERFRLVTFRQNDLPGIAVINGALATFEPKIVFSWHLSLMLHFEWLIDNGMPSEADREVIDPQGDLLDSAFKGDDIEKPNSLFLARITWNKTRELVYRVCDPEPISRYLVDIIENERHARPFDYRIDNDPDWKLARWHLGAGT